MKNILKEGKCLSREEMEQYLAGLLSPAQVRAVEEHLAGCELCSDALEGLSVLSPEEINESLTNIENRIHNRIKEKPVIMMLLRRAIAVAAVLILLIGGAFFLNEYINHKQVTVAEKMTREENVSDKNEAENLKQDSASGKGMANDQIKFTPPVETLREEPTNKKPDDNSNDEYKYVPSLQKNENTVSGDANMEDAPAPVVEEQNDIIVFDQKMDGDKLVEKDATGGYVQDDVSGSSTVTIQSTSPNNSYTWSAAPQQSLGQIETISGKKNKNGKDAEVTMSTTKSISATDKLADSISVDIFSDLYNQAMQYIAADEKQKAIDELDKLIKLNNELKPQAMWEKSLLLIELNKKDKAKIVLTDLSKISSPYQQLAIDKLKEL